jgi:hypothetical protein
MDYRGIRYTIRAGIERRQWFVVIHPEGVKVSPNKIFGSREDAEVQAHRMIREMAGRSKIQAKNKQKAIDQVSWKIL